MSKKVLHLTTVHPRFDVRVFYKEARALSKEYQVSIVVADGLGSEDYEGVSFIDLGKPKNRWSRVLFYPFKLLRKSIKHKADIYHFHDPELMLVGLLLRLLGKKVIYDVHEHVPESFFLKVYMSKIFQYVGYMSSLLFESVVSRFYSGIIVVTPRLHKRFQKINKRTVIVANYPDVKLVSDNRKNFQNRSICYAGGITSDRGILQVLEALDDVDAQFLLAGRSDARYLDELKRHRNWCKVVFFGELPWKEVFKKLYSQASLGLLTMLPAPNTNDALPIKLFEYMACGLPVISTDIPLWNEILVNAECGVCIDPTAKKMFSDALNRMLDNEKLLEQYSLNAKKSIRNHYNWQSQEETLLKFYGELI